MSLLHQESGKETLALPFNFLQSFKFQTIEEAVARNKRHFGKLAQDTLDEEERKRKAEQSKFARAAFSTLGGMAQERERQGYFAQKRQADERSRFLDLVAPDMERLQQDDQVKQSGQERERSRFLDLVTPEMEKLSQAATNLPAERQELLISPEAPVNVDDAVARLTNIRSRLSAEGRLATPQEQQELSMLQRIAERRQTATAGELSPVYEREPPEIKGANVFLQPVSQKLVEDIRGAPLGPFADPLADVVAGATSPVGILTGGAGGLPLAAKSLAGSVLLGAAGEATGIPGARYAGEIAGGLAGPTAPALARAGYRRAGAPTLRQLAVGEAGEAPLDFGIGQPPREPPGPPVGAKPSGGGDPIDGLFDGVLPNEKPSRAALASYEGRSDRQALQVYDTRQRGNARLKNLGKGAVVNNPNLSDGELTALTLAIHGEGPVPPRLQAVYDELRPLWDLETADMRAFDPDATLIENYVYRGWKPKEGAAGGRGGLGTKPGFTKQRNELSFTEMLEAGYEPISNNPYDMWAIRRLDGIRYREQSKLIERLKATGQAVEVDGPVPEGWRTPRVGPAFEGKAIVYQRTPARGEGQAIEVGRGREKELGFGGYTKRVIVPDDLAGRLENMFGSPVDWGKIGPLDIHKAITRIGNALKRVKLVGGVFQQADFAGRSGFAAFGGAADDVLHGHPISAANKVIQLPATLGKMAWANVSPARRAALRQQLLSTEPILTNRPGVTPRAILDSGMKTTDISMFQNDLRSVITEAASSPPTGWHGAANVVTRRVDQINKAVQRGLFEGVYPQAQITALRNLIVPRLARAHPTWTDAQIARSAADEVNKMFSTLGHYQTVLGSSRNLSDFAHALIFSTNEAEALIKQALSTVAGPNKGLWTEFYLGGALFLAATANVVHFAATGENLPFDRYTPIRLSKYSPIGVDYNPEFMSPDVPGIKGRGGVPLKVDLMMQMDTVFRVLDPANFIKARENVGPRAILSQLEGKDFYGRPLSGPKDRITQAVADLGMPIPGQNIAGIIRDKVPGAADWIPEGEGRLGASGLGAQISGVNLRAEPTRALLDRWAQESGLQKADGAPVQRWDDLEPSQRKQAEADTQLQHELELRSETQLQRGGEPGYAKLKEVDQRRLAEEAQAVQLFQRSGDGEIFRKQVQSIQANAAIERAQVDRDFALFKERGTLPSDPSKRALVEYYNVFSKARLPGGGLDFDTLDSEMASLEKGWTPAQKAYVERNIGLTEHSPEVRRVLAAGKLISGYYDIPKWRGVSLDRQEQIQEVHDLVAQLKIQMARSGRPDISTKALYRLAVTKYGVDPELRLLAYKLRPGSKTASKRRNPLAESFLLENARELEPFYPELYRRETLQVALGEKELVGVR